ncbi:EF-hand domain-containing protein [Entamoeba marina]
MKHKHCRLLQKASSTSKKDHGSYLHDRPLPSTEVMDASQPQNPNIIFRSFDSGNDLKNTSGSKKKPKTNQKQSKKVIISNKPKTLSFENIRCINHLLPMHKHLRIQQWVSNIPSESLYPHPMNFID